MSNPNATRSVGASWVCSSLLHSAAERRMAGFGDRFVGAMRLDAQTFEEIEHDPSAMGQAITVVIISAVADGLGRLFVLGSPGLVAAVVGALIGYAAWAGFVWLVGTKVMPDPDTK